ncbi:MAG: chalcone isomerase family protein [Aureliella sp.]
MVRKPISKTFVVGTTLALVWSLTSGPVLADLAKELKISGQTLKLNGAGKRTKTFIQIYESGLYLKDATANASTVLDSDAWMAIRVQITSGFVKRDSLVSSLEEGLKQSTGGRTETIAKETDLFLKCLKDEVKKNDVYDFVYVPSRGLYILKNAKVQGSIPGIEFKKALFGIWLSDAPVDKKLKQAMLTGPMIR